MRVFYTLFNKKYQIVLDVKSNKPEDVKYNLVAKISNNLKIDKIEEEIFDFLKDMIRK
jgi:hypothetical protein